MLQARGSGLQAPGFSLQTRSRLSARGFRFQVLGFSSFRGSRIQAPGARLQDPGSRLRGPGSRLKRPGSFLALGLRLQAPRPLDLGHKGFAVANANF